MSHLNSDLYLDPDQENLLIAALSSNRATNQNSDRSNSNFPQNNPQAETQSANQVFTPNSDKKTSFDSSAMSAPGSGHLDFDPDDSPYLDFEDDNFDFDINGQMIGDLPDQFQHDGHDLHEKRKSIDGKDDDDEGGGKRREGDDKSAKKPGRKPLTSEPTTKRKAQNRAAQRAFRERKEKHLKDLETKVEDLEKASESTNHENGLLRAQVDRLQVELREYRKRLSWVSSGGLGRSPTQSASNTNARNSVAMNNNDFQFEFPKFGDLPSTSMFGNSSKLQGLTPTRSATAPSNSNAAAAPGVILRNSMSSSSPQAGNWNYGVNAGSPQNRNSTASPGSHNGSISSQQPSNIDALSDLFSPSIIEAGRNASLDYGFPQFAAPAANPARSVRNGVDQNSPSSVPGLYNGSSVSNTDSPSSSTDSQHHASSIGTSPEPSLSSPGNKLIDTGLSTINEDNKGFNAIGGASVTPGYDPNGFNWLAQQNGGSFDPVLFNDYREPQDAVVTQDFGSFFNDAFPLPDLGSPQHNFNEVAPAPGAKLDLMKQVEAAQNADDEEVVPGEDHSKMMTCNKIWDRLQSMEKFRNGELDVDNLCSELRSKARCSEGGAVVDKKDVERILGHAQ